MKVQLTEKLTQKAAIKVIKQNFQGVERPLSNKYCQINIFRPSVL